MTESTTCCRHSYLPIFVPISLLFQHTHPPSTLYTAPVTNEASSLSKKAITFAISIGSARRFWAVTCKPLLTCSGSSPWDIGVFTDPTQHKNRQKRLRNVIYIPTNWGLPGDTQLTLIC